MVKSLKEREFLRNVLPYGVYVHSDGSETLFARDYQPIATRTPDRRQITPTSGHINFEWQAWFFDDGNPPWGSYASEKNSADSTRNCQQVMFNFMAGLPISDFFQTTSKGVQFGNDLYHK